MKVYTISLAAGLLVGIINSLLQVRSPAPPLVALIGLLGILVGEQIIPLGKKMWSNSAEVSVQEQQPADVAQTPSTPTSKPKTPSSGAS